MFIELYQRVPFPTTPGVNLLMEHWLQRLLSMGIPSLELEKMIMLFIKPVLYLEDHGQRLQMLLFQIWLIQMDIYMEFHFHGMYGELYQILILQIKTFGVNLLHREGHQLQR